jgi:hypothetical protein
MKILFFKPLPVLNLYGSPRGVPGKSPCGGFVRANFGLWRQKQLRLGHCATIFRAAAKPAVLFREPSLSFLT